MRGPAVEDVMMLASPTSAFSAREPAGYFHRRACLFVDESCRLHSNFLGNVFIINFTFLKTRVKQSHADAQER